MNKQELIDRLASLVGSMEEFKGINDFYDGKYAGLEYALELIKQLDEPQKPVVPMFIAELIKQGKKQCFTLYGTMECANLKLFTDSIHREKCKAWLLDWHNQETFAQAWLFGYEIKEPLYRVKLGEGYFVEYQGRGALIIPDDNKEIKIFDSKSDAERTAQTIGGTVEEVAE